MKEKEIVLIISLDAVDGLARSLCLYLVTGLLHLVFFFMEHNSCNNLSFQPALQNSSQNTTENLSSPLYSFPFLNVNSFHLLDLTSFPYLSFPLPQLISSPFLSFPLSSYHHFLFSSLLLFFPILSFTSTPLLLFHFFSFTSLPLLSTHIKI